MSTRRDDSIDSIGALTDSGVVQNAAIRVGTTFGGNGYGVGRTDANQTEVGECIRTGDVVVCGYLDLLNVSRCEMVRRVG